MWLLVLLNVMYNPQGEWEPVVEGFYEYETMQECFVAHDHISQTIDVGDGKQAICIYKILP